MPLLFFNNQKYFRIIYSLIFVRVLLKFVVKQCCIKPGTTIKFHYFDDVNSFNHCIFLNIFTSFFVSNLIFICFLLPDCIHFTRSNNVYTFYRLIKKNIPHPYLKLESCAFPVRSCNCGDEKKTRRVILLPFRYQRV